MLQSTLPGSRTVVDPQFGMTEHRLGGVRGHQSQRRLFHASYVHLAQANVGVAVEEPWHQSVPGPIDDRGARRLDRLVGDLGDKAVRGADLIAWPRLGPAGIQQLQILEQTAFRHRASPRFLVCT